MNTVSLGLVWAASSGAKLTRPAMRAAATLLGVDGLAGDAGWALASPEGADWALASPEGADWSLARPEEADWALARPGANLSLAWARALSKALMSSDWGGKLARTRSQY
jgi:hypothetical protein